ncbi:TBC1 domain family member 23 [Fragariocoptes setiger]|uniref:TBC1 domain family member 23 n=1 Tax=Fragariocoptes setiger TaxID=1670756 RepID=A0ABQ7S501_9ACAR|nr:TBC1 domain family member 23 [Fragariocoptes setiger]
MDDEIKSLDEKECAADKKLHSLSDGFESESIPYSSITTNSDTNPSSPTIDSNNWIDELECALLADCDLNTLRKISEGKRIPRTLRTEFWKALLAVPSSGRLTLSKECDCEKLVRELSQLELDHCELQKHLSSEAAKLSMRSDFESTITTYSKARPELRYTSNNGWCDILKIIATLSVNEQLLYQLFLRIVDRYIPKDLNFAYVDSQNLAPQSIVQANSEVTSDQNPSNSTSKKRRLVQSHHLLRLLLQYHDPELCTLLDSKKITPDLYANDWFCCLFARCCSINISLLIWDAHFRMADAFLIFFAAIVMIVNARDELFKRRESTTDEMVEILSKVPRLLQEDDIDDLYYLVSNHYANMTPRSIRAFSHLFFMDTPLDTRTNLDGEDSNELARFVMDKSTIQLTSSLDLSQCLCIPVVPAEIIIPKQNSNSASCDVRGPKNNRAVVNYFLVDCRPADQYNSGHLAKAFHLDCGLMIQEPAIFTDAVKTLLEVQEQVIASGSSIGGQHMCFIGSGREEEDQYVNMVVASFLQKQQQYVSLVVGGFEAIHEYVESRAELQFNFDHYIVEHNLGRCLSCQTKLGPAEQAARNITRSPTGSIPTKQYLNASQSLISSTASFIKSHDKVQHSGGNQTANNQSGTILDKMTSALISKSSVFKDKIVESLSNPSGSTHTNTWRHVSPSDKLGRRYTGNNNYANVGEDDDPSTGDATNNEEVQIDSWCKQDDIIGSFKCAEMKGEVKYPGYLALSKTHLWILREIPHNKGYARVVSKRPLENIVQITSKRRQPESIIFRYGKPGNLTQNRNSKEAVPEIVASDQLHIPQAFDVIRLVKREVVRIMDSRPMSVSDEPAQSNQKLVDKSDDSKPD